MPEKKKEFDVQFRVVAIIEAKVKAESMEQALEISKGYKIGDFIKANVIHDASLKVVGVDDDWGDME